MIADVATLLGGAAVVVDTVTVTATTTRSNDRSRRDMDDALQWYWSALHLERSTAELVRLSTLAHCAGSSIRTWGPTSRLRMAGSPWSGWPTSGRASELSRQRVDAFEAGFSGDEIDLRDASPAAQMAQPDVARFEYQCCKQRQDESPIQWALPARLGGPGRRYFEAFVKLPVEALVIRPGPIVVRRRVQDL